MSERESPSLVVLGLEVPSRGVPIMIVSGLASVDC